MPTEKGAVLAPAVYVSIAIEDVPDGDDIHVHAGGQASGQHGYCASSTTDRSSAHPSVGKMSAGADHRGRSAARSRGPIDHAIHLRPRHPGRRRARSRRHRPGAVRDDVGMSAAWWAAPWPVVRVAHGRVHGDRRGVSRPADRPVTFAPPAPVGGALVCPPVSGLPLVSTSCPPGRWCAPDTKTPRLVGRGIFAGQTWFCWWWARGDLNPHVHKDTRT